jgi:hypothetical protein
MIYDWKNSLVIHYGNAKTLLQAAGDACAMDRRLAVMRMRCFWEAGDACANDRRGWRKKPVRQNLAETGFIEPKTSIAYYSFSRCDIKTLRLSCGSFSTPVFPQSSTPVIRDTLTRKNHH